MPHLHAVNTSMKEDTENQLKLKTDILIYDRVEGVAPPNRTDFLRMELWMEFKTKNDRAAFQDPLDPDSEELRRLATEEGSFTWDTGRDQCAWTIGTLCGCSAQQTILAFLVFGFGGR